MPPRTRTRAVKASKENIGVKGNTKAKNIKKGPRKVLGDKTNSASDDNASVEVLLKSEGTAKKVVDEEVDKNVRPRRDRRLPTRFAENRVLTNLSNSKDATPDLSVRVTPIKTNKTASKKNNSDISPFKTPSKAESSLVVNRPKRICRLPSKFDDHSISPNKYIPIKPSNASTPIQQGKGKSTTKDVTSKCDNKSSNKNDKVNVDNKPTVVSRPLRTAKSAALQKKINDNNSTDNSSPDTNNNPKGRSLRVKKTEKNQSSPNEQNPLTNKLRDKNLSFKVLEDKNAKNQSNEDVYEFTYDPNEEPKPQKKKRKVVKKRNDKPKTVTYKSNYNLNINKSLAALKNIIAKNPQPKTDETKKVAETVAEKPLNPVTNAAVTNTDRIDHTNIVMQTSIVNTQKDSMTGNDSSMPNTGKDSVHETNYPSIRVEDIAADIEPSMNQDDINYSPINSPCQPNTPNQVTNTDNVPVRHTNDPLNLQEDFSFDDQPVASSSMNVSVRHPLASPWRVEFGSLPLRWHVNTYVKADMTPAVESSFISSSDSINRKKHIYTNMVPQATEPLPEIVANTSNWKQTSIISFIKEVAEKQAAKKKRSVSPIKYNSLFEDIPNLSAEKKPHKHKDKNATKKDLTLGNRDTENVTSDSKESDVKENSGEAKKSTRKRKNNLLISNKPAKSPRKQKDKELTYFGFDDSENQEQENVSPIKVNNTNLRGLRPRTRPALQELNTHTGPMRGALPASKTIIASSDAVSRAYEEPKSAADAPEFPAKETAVDDVTNINDDNDDSQSVHLFEDIEVVHHLKPSRKSYGKAKKVTFRQRSLSDSDSSSRNVIDRHASSDEDDLADLTFEVPNIKEKKIAKKKKPKKLMSKKEEREADEWAAGFNSMCEDIEEFPLLVE